MNIAKHTILTLLVLATALFTACSDEDAVTMPGTDAPNAPGLHIALSLGGKQPVYAAKQTRANTIEGEKSLNENTVKTVDFFLFSPEMETVNDVKQVKKDANGDTIWVRKHYGRHTVSNQTMTDDDANDKSPDANGNAVIPDYYPTEYFTIASGSSTTWIETLGLVPGSRLYALANVDWSKATLPAEEADGTITYTATSADAITSIDQLKSLSVLDTDIYKKEKADESTDETVSETADTQEMTDKLFLMDGCYRFTQTDINTYTGTPNAVHQETVDLRRAAAKVRVNIYKAPSWKDSEGNTVTITTDAIVAKVSNYATRTKAFADGNDLGDNGHVSTYAELGTYDRKLDAPSGKTYLTSVLFYTFAHDWSEDIGHETTFIMNLPYEGRTNNWYKIVFVPDGGQRYNRNTFYEVDVTVAYDGSEDSYEPVIVKDQYYKVSEWMKEELPVDNNPAVDYLILDRYYIDMRNEADATITFYSSNYVTVEVVDDQAAETEWLSDEYGKEFPYPVGFDETDYEGTPVTTVSGVAEIPGIYYVDKEGRRVPIYSSESYSNSNNSSAVSLNTQNSFTDLNRAEYKPVTLVRHKGDDKNSLISDKEGTAITAGSLASKEDSEVYITWPGYKTDYSQDGLPISIHSKIPRNLAPRYITLRVTMPKMYCSGNIIRYVIIKQYPLEYVVNRFGLASYIDATVLNRDANDVTHYNGSRTSWNFSNGSLVPTEIQNILNGHLDDGGNFRCKFYVDGTSQSFSTDLDMSQYQREDAEGVHNGNIYYAYNGEAALGIQSAFNNRMYEVRITVTSPDYRIGYPKMDGSGDNVYAEASKLNADLVSPHFILASQLGNCSATANWVTAHDHCLHYVEVESVTNPDGTVKVVQHKDWRLPTLAELKLLKTYQIDDDVFNVTMNRVLNSDGDGDPRYWSSAENWYLDTTGGGGEVYQERGTGTYSWNSDYTGYYKGETNITKPADTGTKIRMRCVRDEKNE